MIDKRKNFKVTELMLARAQYFIDNINIPPGEKMTISVCAECKKVQAHVFIPYGLGRGKFYDMCYDNAVSSNWPFYYEVKIAEVEITKESKNIKFFKK